MSKKKTTIGIDGTQADSILAGFLTFILKKRDGYQLGENLFFAYKQPNSNGIARNAMKIFTSKKKKGKKQIPQFTGYTSIPVVIHMVDNEEYKPEFNQHFRKGLCLLAVDLVSEDMTQVNEGLLKLELLLGPRTYSLEMMRIIEKGKIIELHEQLQALQK